MVNCAVNVAPGVPIKFEWLREVKAEKKANLTLSRRSHTDTRTESELTLVTYKDEDYNDLLCIAKTPSTTKIHRITIKQLSKYITIDSFHLKRHLQPQCFARCGRHFRLHVNSVFRSSEFNPSEFSGICS